MQRTRFPGVFWTGNIIEILERFAYYGLYMGFAIYATKTVAEGGLGWSESRLGDLQSIFLFLSYSIPLISGVLADRYGFKTMLIVSYMLYLPGFLLLLVTKQFTLMIMVMGLIAVAAGFFKPLIAGTVRLTTDQTNRTLGFGIFYLMVNVGAFFGPMTAGALRTRNWDYAFLASAGVTVLMLLITMVWYRNPIEVKQEAGQRVPLTQHLKEMLPYLKDPKILTFIIIFGVFIEIPFWAFFNICPMFADRFVRTDILYDMFTGALATVVGTGWAEWFIGLFATEDANGVHHIAGETLAHTALYIIILQMLVTRSTERIRSVPTVALGILGMFLGCVGLFYSTGTHPMLLFAGILLFAVGEMACMPRFEQYLISMLPPEKTGLGGGLIRIPVAIGGALSGVTVNRVYERFINVETPQTIWLVLGASLLGGFVAVMIFDRIFRSAD